MQDLGALFGGQDLEHNQVAEALAASLEEGFGGVRQRTQASFLRELPLLLGDDALVEERECGICLEEFALDCYVLGLPCKHFYHQQCIDLWLTQSSNVCPQDSLPVLPEEDDGK